MKSVCPQQEWLKCERTIGPYGKTPGSGLPFEVNQVKCQLAWSKSETLMTE